MLGREPSFLGMLRLEGETDKARRSDVWSWIAFARDHRRILPPAENAAQATTER